MAKSLAELQQVLSKVKPWVWVAAILAVALFAYYSMLGLRYMDASGDVSSFKAEISDLAAKLKSTSPNVDALTAEQQVLQAKLQDVQEGFMLSESDSLIGIISITAQETGVSLGRIATSPLGSQEKNGILFSTLPISVTLRGNTVDIYRFLSLLQQKVPVAQVADITLINLEGDPTAQVELLFFLSPEVPLDE